VILKGEHIAIGTLHDIDIAHKKPFRNHDGRLNRLNSLCVRPHISLKLAMAGPDKITSQPCCFGRWSLSYKTA
jgi:hypothetical protein